MKKKSVILLIIVILWMGFIFLMSSDTGEDSGSKSRNIIVFIVSKYDKITNASPEIIKYHNSYEFISKVEHVFRKMCHFGEYFILGILLISFLISLNKFSVSKIVIYSLLIVFFYACTDEFHQTFVDGRSGEILDISIDTLGGFTGLGIVFLINNKFNNRKNIE